MRAIIVGFGFIGRSLAEALYQKRQLLNSVDREFKVIGVSQSDGYLFDANGLNLEKLSAVQRISKHYGDHFHDASSLELVENYDADLLIEATPTNVRDGEPGLSHIETALKKGMDVVTSNKGPLVVAFNKLVQTAEKKGVELKFEGTVAGALPALSIIQQSFQGDTVLKISGILNGTANFILSKMYFEETSFELALKEAQEVGITEEDPSYDVDGVDAACKVVILANAVMKRDVKFKDVNVVGIRRITPEAINSAKRAGYAIKLIGSIDNDLEVAPKLVPELHPLCVHGTLNAIHFETDLAREITLVGYGAGRETIAAMINDTLSVIKKRTSV